MEKRIAGFIITPVWRDVIQNILLKIPDEPFIKPEPFEESKPVLRGEWRGGWRGEW